MNCYLFAAGPLHIINFFEFLSKNKIRKYKIFVFKNKSEIVNQQLIQTIKFLNIKNYTFITWNNLKVIRLCQYIYFIYNLKNKTATKKNVFIISDFKNSFFHVLRLFFKNSRFILTDEGSGTLVSYQKYIARNIYFPIYSYKKYIIYIFRLLLPKALNFIIRTKIDIFSFHYLIMKDKNIMINNMSFLKKKLINVNIKDNKVVLFSGTRLSERKAITLSEELEILKKIKNHWDKKKKKLVYVAKRSTSKKKMDLIVKKLNIECIRFKLPLELAIGYEYKKIPFAHCSLGGTLNVTLRLIYNIKSTTFISNKYKDPVVSIYHKEYKSSFKNEVIKI